MSTKFLIVVFVLNLFIIAESDPIQYKDCGTVGVKINYFDVANCKTLPCIFKKNTNQTLLLSFTASSNYDYLNDALYGIIAGVKVPFPVADPLVCHLNVQCPLKQGNTYIQNLTLPILSEFPSISLFAELHMNDPQSKQIMCALFPVKITN